MNQRNDSQRETFTVKEAAMKLGISDSLARDLISNGQLTAFRYGPRKTVIYREDLEKFRQSRKVEPPSKEEAS